MISLVATDIFTAILTGLAGATQGIMREGWMADTLFLPANFLDSDVGQNFQAFHAFTKVYEALWDAHSTGF